MELGLQITAVICILIELILLNRNSVFQSITPIQVLDWKQFIGFKHHLRSQLQFEKNDSSILTLLGVNFSANLSN